MTLAFAIALMTQTCSPQHAAMGHCAMTMPMPKAPAVKAKPARRVTPAVRKARPQAAALPPAATPTEAASMSMPMPAAPEAAAACAPEHAAMGHCTPTAPAAIGNAPPPPSVPATYADRIWGAAAMAPSRDLLRREHGGGRFSRIMLDRAEIDPTDDGYRWDADAWLGGDIDRLVVKTEGKGRARLEQAEVTALYSRAVGPYFNVQAGVRHDLRPEPSRTHVVLGVEGLAPYWFDVEAHAFLSTKGELRAEVSADYDQRITQRLILQPRVEVDLSAQDIPALGVAAGMSGAELGLRLRYEIAREFAPYVGVVHERRWGSGGDTSTGVVLGVRAWF
ncbi:copper resistance protein B [Sphingomonas sp. RS2018]